MKKSFKIVLGLIILTIVLVILVLISKLQNENRINECIRKVDETYAGCYDCYQAIQLQKDSCNVK